MLTVEGVAKELGRCEKQVRRYIREGLLKSTTRLQGGRHRIVVESTEVARYKPNQFFQRWRVGWLDRAMTPFLLTGADSKELEDLGLFPETYVYGEASDGTQLIPYRLTIPLLDFPRLTRLEPDGRARAAIGTELRERIPGGPRAFAVQFQVDLEEAARTLQPIVLTVRPPKIPGIDREELQAEALIHLLTVSMRSLGRVMADPSAYFAVAVMNFYRDKLEGVQRERKRDLKRRRYADEVMDDVETAEDLDHIGG